MPATRRLVPSICLAGLCGLAWVSAPAPATTTSPSRTAAALLHSRELWATIDVCNPPSEPNTIGIRGSMPGDGRAGDRMYMSFALQRLTAVNQWEPLPSARSPWIAAGSGASARQVGSSFTLTPVSGHVKYTIRGVVSFRWIHAKRVIAHTLVPTTGAHKALLGSNPAGYSAASCTIG